MEESMARNQIRRIRPSVRQADHSAYVALQALSHYESIHDCFSKDNVTADLEAMQAAQQAEMTAQNALATARDDAAAAEWKFHNSMLGVKTQVIALFGHDSNEVQSLGLTKESERKRPGRKVKAAE
jgi:hypothetical protein